MTFWGVSDAHTWISGDTPLLFDARYSAKPAYAGVLDAPCGGNITFPAFPGSPL